MGNNQQGGGTDVVLVGDIKRAGAILEARADKFAELLPVGVKPERFAAVVLQSVRSAPRLLTCTQDSFMEAAMRCASLGLEPAQGQAFLIPRNLWNKELGAKVMTACFQLGYQGKELAYRSGEYSLLEAHVVYEKDKFSYARGLHPDIVHEPSKEDHRGESTHFYSIAWPKKKDATPIFEVMTKAEVDGIRARSASATDGPWVTDYNEIGRKTVFSRLAKWLQLTPEAREAFAEDMALEYGDPSVVLSTAARDAVHTGTVQRVAQVLEEEANAAAPEPTGAEKLGQVLTERFGKPQPPEEPTEEEQAEVARQKALLEQQKQADDGPEPEPPEEDEGYPMRVHQGTSDKFPRWLGDLPPVKALPEVLPKLNNKWTIADMWASDSRMSAQPHYHNRLAEFEGVEDPETLLEPFVARRPAASE